MFGEVRLYVYLLIAACIFLPGAAFQAALGAPLPESDGVLYHKSKKVGDFDVMEKDHMIRFLVPFSKTFYFLEKGKQMGLAYESVKFFEKYINQQQQKGHVKIKAVIIPTPRDRLIPDLAEGYGDIAVGNLTITPERLKIVDFGDPFYRDVREVVITPGNAPSFKSLFDLAGKQIFVRKSSSYHESLLHVNETLAATGKKPITIMPADEYLEDEDLLEMVNAGLIPMVVVDLHKADLWKQVFPHIKVHDNIVIHSGGNVAWAIRKKSPLLKKQLNSFVKTHRQGTLHFNILMKRYLKSTKYARNNVSKKEIKKFNDVVKLFQKYGDQYAFDWLMLGALAYQESGLDQGKRSKAGAVGIMQVLPSTAADSNVNIQGIDKLEPNVHAGTKYLRFMADRYYSGQEVDTLNKYLFSFASYNAGPARVARLRKEAMQNGLDPNIWFNNVELVAARRIGRETVQYVSNIYKYYVAYKLIVRDIMNKEVGKKILQQQYAN
ncbi:lytic transglycosylase F [Desulfogranum marinum]|uniref:transglycosylase SLT domain-containing protein n=1 Tax=Desulfogranum marinum TaxID=453220 RepID=UPI001965D500|nr:lytic transglycosylase F [Desulfogranum marinum]MBM9512087.1 lytic transglycosylase F [Desulfogranum marinum]